MEEKRVYLQIWNPDTDELEWREFSIDEVDELMDCEILDTDTLGYAMDNAEAFEKVMEMVSGRVFTYSEVVREYTRLTNEDLRIEW